MKIRYFDHAATTAVKDEVLNEMIPYFCMEFGNPSSMYSVGRKNRRVIENAREKVAKAIGAEVKEIYFTSCGSESDNLSIKGIAYANKSKGNHIITTKIEHPAVLNTCKRLEQHGFEVTYLNVNKKGLINLYELETAINEKTILISIMFANNEIGTIQPIKEIGEIAKKNNIILHTDAVQAVGNIEINVKKMNIGALSLSAHKFYGPKGIGAVYIKNGIEFQAIQDGGHQEKGKRAGTENVALIVGLGKAIEISQKSVEQYNDKLKQLRDYFFTEVENKISDIIINGDKENRLPGNCNISFKNVDGEILLLKLDEVGICASTGSACTSGFSAPSHVLVELGIPNDYIHGSLRITFGEENTKEDVDFLIKNLIEIIEKLRKENINY